MKHQIDEEVGYFEGPFAKHIMFTIGDDFQYQNAAQNYLNWDKMILHFNQKYGKSIKLMYSTPSCFIRDIYQEQPEHKWPQKQDDFFPYADNMHGLVDFDLVKDFCSAPPPSSLPY